MFPKPLLQSKQWVRISGVSDTQSSRAKHCCCLSFLQENHSSVVDFRGVTAEVQLINKHVAAEAGSNRGDKLWDTNQYGMS